MTDNAARLACFDREVAALAQAEAAREVVVVDQEQIRQTRRTLFGLPLPNLGRIFRGRESDEITEIQATIAAARGGGSGRWSIELDDGSTWLQTDSQPLARDPRQGMPIRIRRGALGSFMANIDGQRAIRVARQR